MTAVVEALLRGVIDYAGTFPPARLSVSDALAEYLEAGRGAHGWMLGSFVVAADHLQELASTGNAARLPVSVVMRGGTALNPGPGLKVVALEFPALPAVEIPQVAAASRGPTLFFEVPADEELEPRLDAILAAGACAKIRTGGITASAFPGAASIYRFFKACADRGLPCKATAGLHHAMTGSYPLTYEPGCASAGMFGFLNILLAAALVSAGAQERDVVGALNETTWRDPGLPVGQIEAMRRTLFRSFGSCSVREPFADLARLHLT